MSHRERDIRYKEEVCAMATIKPVTRQEVIISGGELTPRNLNEKNKSMEVGNVVRLKAIAKQVATPKKTSAKRKSNK